VHNANDFLPMLRFEERNKEPKGSTPHPPPKRGVVKYKNQYL
jgi:hypothetical protein